MTLGGWRRRCCRDRGIRQADRKRLVVEQRTHQLNDHNTLGLMDSAYFVDAGLILGRPLAGPINHLERSTKLVRSNRLVHLFGPVIAWSKSEWVINVTHVNFYYYFIFCKLNANNYFSWKNNSKIFSSKICFIYGSKR
ncbi:hypothetical protein Cni_G17934 [Canna indica]|uniref:Uncharacterized protein n=1 Tax=Canna indica TaxID=4628 RepID=A0AAQ3QH26_9LILI|nr:hypothetical protein Cni_G17934 [Canna indica]